MAILPMPSAFPEDVIHQVQSASIGDVILQSGTPIGIISEVRKEKHKRTIFMETLSGHQVVKFSFNGSRLDGFDMTTHLDPMRSIDEFKAPPTPKSYLIPELPSSGGFLVPPGMTEFLAKMGPSSIKFTASAASDNEIAPWAFEHEGTTYQVIMTHPERMGDVLAGHDAQDIMMSFMGAIILMTSSQMAMDETQRSDMYFKALKILEGLFLLQVDEI